MKTLALTCGQNLVIPAHYNGWNGGLYGCGKDAAGWAEWATQFACGPEDRVESLFSDVLGTRRPGVTGELPPYRDVYDCRLHDWTDDTGKLHAGCINRVRRMAADAVAGDAVILTDSGHGTVRGTLGEADLTGEGLCFADGVLWDTELRALLCLFRDGVRVFVILDTCYAGGMDRAGTRIISRFAPQRYTADAALDPQPLGDAAKAQPAASVLIWSACGENETSGDTPFGGVFTTAALAVWRDYSVAKLRWVTPRKFHEDTAAFLLAHRSAQHPQLKTLGPDISTQPFFRA